MVTCDIIHFAIAIQMKKRDAEVVSETLIYGLSHIFSPSKLQIVEKCVALQEECFSTL